jgi:AmmeMemoRadiSam system protein B
MAIRKAAVAGQFYGATRQECLDEIAECLPKEPIRTELPSRITAGIVPHAGWVFSGDLAAMVFAAVKQVNKEVDTFVIFGAAHRCYDTCPVIYPNGAWETPLGQISIDEPLAKKLIQLGANPDAEAHRHEHSIEVQVPFIQHLFPDARLVAVIMPPGPGQYECRFGQRVGALLKDSGANVVCIASTDLTHYGPRYGFCPQGTGQTGIGWAYEVNDAEFIERAIKMDAEHLVESSLRNENACGPAAAAAVVATAQAAGCKKGFLLSHTNSAKVMEARFHQSSNESVGYAAIVF